jgi:hypothetical protein
MIRESRCRRLRNLRTCSYPTSVAPAFSPQSQLEGLNHERLSLATDLGGIDREQDCRLRSDRGRGIWMSIWPSAFAIGPRFLRRNRQDPYCGAASKS